MQKTYTVTLDDFDLGQVLDCLELRARTWEATAQFHYTGRSAKGFVVEECNDAREAKRLAAHYWRIIGQIETQREAQS